MYFKLLVSLLLVFLGIYLIINGSSSLHHMHPTPETFWQKTGDFFTHNSMWNPIIKFFGGTPIPENSYPHKAPAIVTLITGSLLLLSGLFFGLSVLRRRNR